MKRSIVAGLMAGLFIIVVFASQPATAPVSAQAISGLPVGATCTIQLRRDVLGLSTNAPLALYDARDTSFQINGTLISAEGDWLTIKASDTRTHWVARGSIAMVTVDTTPKAQ